MKSKHTYIKAYLVLATVLILPGCSLVEGFLPADDNIDYKSTVKQKSLEVPPDLSQPKRSNAMDVPDLNTQANTYRAYHGQQAGGATTAATQQALSSSLGIRYMHDGPHSWLVIKASRDQLWPRVREFWLKNGLVLVVDDKQKGIMETEWAENRAKIAKGAISKILGGLIDSAYNTGTRDKFRVRLEEGSEPGTLELYISHRGMIEQVTGGTLEYEGSYWSNAPSDPALEANMLKRLLIDLGVQKKHAETLVASKKTRQPNARLVTEGDLSQLIINKGFARSWRLVGLALDRVSFTVIDRDRSKGIYYVKYSDPDRVKKKSGILSKLAFWSDDEKSLEKTYQVTLVEKQANVQVRVNDDKGKPDTTSTSDRILNLLLEQLK